MSITFGTLFVTFSDDKIGNHPMYGPFGDAFLQEEIQVRLNCASLFDIMSIFC